MKAHKIEPKATIEWLLSCMQSSYEPQRPFAACGSRFQRLHVTISRKEIQENNTLLAIQLF